MRHLEKSRPNISLPVVVVAVRPRDNDADGVCDFAVSRDVATRDSDAGVRVCVVRDGVFIARG